MLIGITRTAIVVENLDIWQGIVGIKAWGT